MIEWASTYKIFLAAVLSVAVLAWIERALHSWAWRNPEHRCARFSGWIRRAISATIWIILAATVAAHVYGIFTAEPAQDADDCRPGYDNRGMTCE